MEQMKVQTLLVVTNLPVRAVVLVLEISGIVQVRILLHEVVQLHADARALLLVVRHVDVPERAHSKVLAQHIEEFW